MKDKEELDDAHTELVRLRDERDRTIDAYMETKDFVHVMRAHNDTVFPSFFRTGWNAGVRTIQEHYPNINPVSYQSPDDVALIHQFRRQATISDYPMPEASTARTVAEDFETSSGETASEDGSSSEEEEDGENM